MSTIKVEKRMAAQSGIRVWTTRGSDSKAIAFATNKVTKKRWWSDTTDKIFFAILDYSSFFFIVIISSYIVLMESKPTVIPEQKAPTTVRTKLRRSVYMRRVRHFARTRYQKAYDMDDATPLLRLYVVMRYLLVFNAHCQLYAHPLPSGNHRWVWIGKQAYSLYVVD